MAYLSWFKFTPSDWIMGKIQRTPEITQARFMRLVCLYWNKQCILSLEDAEIEIDKEHIDLLLSKKIIKVEDDFIIIEFLNEQMGTIAETSQKRKEAVLQRWAKVKQNDTSVSKNDTSVLQSDTDKIREEKIREEKIREEKEIEETASPFSFYNSLINAGGNVQLVSDWLKVRKNKKATNTQTAYDSFLKEVVKSKLTINQVLTKCVENSWSGFKSEWQPTITTTKTLNDFHYNANGTMKGVL